MATVEITARNFQQTVDREGILLIDWWAPWCGPCRAFGPVFERSAAQHPDIVFGKVNTDEEQELAAAASIRSIPTLMVFRDGILLFAQPGMLPAQGLEEVIAQVRAVDMDDVRRRIAERERTGGGAEDAER